MRFSGVQPIVGGAALALTVVGIAVSSTSQVLQSYLFAFLFFFGVSAGSMFLLTLQHLTSGVWGLMIRRFTEASTLVIPWMGLFFLPIAAGVGVLYESGRSRSNCRRSICGGQSPLPQHSILFGSHGILFRGVDFVGAPLTPPISCPRQRPQI
jgi:hypothetical protein